jgi:hypothetical protein
VVLLSQGLADIIAAPGPEQDMRGRLTMLIADLQSDEHRFAEEIV